MNVRVFGCAKFRRLSIRELDGELSPRQRRFMELHREVCRECCMEEDTANNALNMLRSYSLDTVEVRPSFDDRVIRRLRVARAKDRIGYWYPAMVGAVIACVAFFAATQLVLQTARMSDYDSPGSEASRIKRRTTPLPEFLLDNSWSGDMSSNGEKTVPLLLRGRS